MNPRELALAASRNALPDILEETHLPALQDALRGFEAVERVADALAAAKNGETRPHMEGLRAALSAIGAKLRPDMSGEQASAWRDAIALSLGKYSTNAARLAAERAQGEPFKFLGAVDARLHELAQEVEDRNHLAKLRLRALHKRIMEPKKALPAPDNDQPMTVEDIAALPDHLVSLGRKLGYITDAEHEAAAALREMS